jgi:hypothetical protein
MNGTHFNFDRTIPGDLGLDPELNPHSVKVGTPSVHMRFGVLRLTFTDADQAQQIAGAFAEAARLLREAGLAVAGEDDGAL